MALGTFFLRNPAEPALVRTIDGLGGFTRSSATSSGIVWKVTDSLPRLSLRTASGQIVELDSTDIGAQTQLNEIGKITLAEKYDRNWRLLLDGKSIKLEKSEIGEPIFNVPSTGKISLEHDGTRRRALLSIQGIIFLTVLVLALPAGRRRREMVDL